MLKIFNFIGLLVLHFIPLSIFAGGILLYEISSADTRLASAGFAARAEDPSTLFTNPAGMTRLCHQQIEFGSQAIFSHVRFDPEESTAGKEGHANLWLPSGSLFYIHPYNEKLTFGIGNLGYFGADLKYNHDWIGRYYVQKTLLEGISLVPACAYRLNEQWSVGVGFNIMYGFFKQRAAVNNVLDQLKDGYLRVQDNRFGFGGILGILYEPTDSTRFGIQYLTAVKLNFKDKPVFKNIGPLLDDLLNDIGIIGSSLDLQVRVPQSLMFSVYHEPIRGLAIMGNVGWQQWSKFQQVSVTLANLDQDQLTFKHKYKDSWHVAVGLESQFNEKLILSSGISYDSSCVSQNERTPNFPVGSQWRIGTGVRLNYSDQLTLDLSSTLQWQGNLNLDVNRGPLAHSLKGVFKNTYALFINFNITYVF